MKVGALHFSKSAPAIAVMHQMKRALDPKVWAASVGWDVWAAGVEIKFGNPQVCVGPLTPGLGEVTTCFPPPDLRQQCCVRRAAITTTLVWRR